MPASGADLFAFLPAAVYATDVNGFLTVYNDAAVELWGHRPVIGEARWCGSHRLYHADMTPMRHEETPLARHLATSSDAARGCAVVAERHDGSFVTFLNYPRRLTDPAGVLVGGLNLLVDITSRELKGDNGRRLAAIIESSDDAIVSKNLNGIIESWNRGAEALFGYTAEEAIGQSIMILIPPDRRHEETRIIEEIKLGRRVATYETIRRHKDGRALDVSITVSPLKDPYGRVIGASKIARDNTTRKQTERRIHMLLREVNHRVKNQYSVILSMIRQTGQRATSPMQFEKQVRERIMGLSRSHDLLVQADWDGAKLEALVRAQLEPFADPEHFRLEGPDIMLKPNAVQYLGIAIHELATNAVKYGALSERGGHIVVEWQIVPGSDGNRFQLSWSEHGAPQFTIPERKGFGTVVLEKVTPAALDGRGTVSYAPTGMKWRLDTPCEQIAAANLPGEPG